MYSNIIPLVVGNFFLLLTGNNNSLLFVLVCHNLYFKSILQNSL